MSSLASVDPRDRRAHRGGGAPPGRHDPADRVGELRLRRGARGDRLGAHQQVLRGLPGQALLRGPAVHRPGRDARASSAPRRCSASTTPTCSRTPARPPTSPSTSRSCKPGDTVWAWAADRRPPHARLDASRSPASSSAPVQYGVRQDTGRIDFDEVRELARERAAEADLLRRHGDPAHDRLPGVRRDRRARSARSCVADIAHIAGLVAGGAHPSPVGHADVDHRRPRTRRCAARAAACSCATPSTPRRSTRPCSPACRAARTTTPPPASRSRCTRRRSRRVQATTPHQIVANAKALADGAASSAASTWSPAAPTTT